MDTDDLTELAYAVLPQAHEVFDVLRVEIGASAMQYSSEDDLLRGTLKWLKGILNDPDSYLDSWNYLDTVDPKRFAEGVGVYRVRSLALTISTIHAIFRP